MNLFNGCKQHVALDVFLGHGHRCQHFLRTWYFQDLCQASGDPLFSHTVKTAPGFHHFVLPSFAAEKVNQRIEESCGFVPVTFGRIALCQTVVKLNQIVSLIPLDCLQVNDFQDFYEMFQGILDPALGSIAFSQGKVTGQTVFRVSCRLR